MFVNEDNNMINQWKPKTDLGILVKQGLVKSLDEIFTHSVKVQEPEIIDYLIGRSNLREEVLVLKNVQKQGKAGQNTSRKAVVVIGNECGYIGYGTGSAKETADAIKKAVIEAKLNIMPIKRGQWQGEGSDGESHTIVAKGSGKSGCKRLKIYPAPIGTGNAYGPIQRKIFKLAGVKDIFVKSHGKSKNRENQAKALVKALQNSSSFYLPSDWSVNNRSLNLFSKFSNQLAEFKNNN